MIRQVPAPGKLNLHLCIGSRGSGGFHDLESVFVLLEYADTLTFAPAERGKTLLALDYAGPLRELISRGWNCGTIPAEENLVYRAVEAFRRKTGYAAGLDITLIKRIPPGSGLGGGSSNAASALLTLNDLAARSGSEAFAPPRAGQAAALAGNGGVSSGGFLSRAELLDLAAELGSDVPFFTAAGSSEALPGAGSTAAWVAGRGERIRFLPPPPSLGILLAFPGFASNTAAAYDLLDKSRKRPVPGLAGCPLLEGRWPPPEKWNFRNDFLDLFLSRGGAREKEGYALILEALKNAGAAFTGLSGSGSACFGIFTGPETAAAAKKKLEGTPYTFHVTFFLACRED
ncbi:MAG: 4-(cytidine 5'-diphospho)-2-C-methyl-D-erythritol kinase [Treponema sp.]|jgi:4-diphosphocytidyl-2-C-methyl-D-erythritol kinase|nr:4-(cytidine 5'-diphospho)-2-C-methyl-D-erythritol kinase [Treponema sp.]